MVPNRYRLRAKRAVLGLVAAVAVTATASLPAWSAASGSPGAAKEVATLAAPGPAAGQLARAGASRMPELVPVSPRPAPTPVTSVRYDFDHGLTDARNVLPLTIGHAAGGTVALIARGTGKAVRYPPPCAHYGSPSCPRAFLQSGAAPGLNPGTRPLRFGAMLLLSARRTSKGENILQKGYSRPGSEFKLQVDGFAGRPSCVLIGTTSSHIYAAIANRTVADGRWHRVDCVRAGTSLTVAIDNTIVGRVTIPTSLSVDNKDPLRIGAKGGSANNDQFNGALDDVYVEVQPR